MSTILKKLPDVIGFYLPGDRRNDQDNLVEDLNTGELVAMPSMTKQSFKDECDINNIVRDFTPQYMAELTMLNQQAGLYQDLPDTIDYQMSLEALRATDAAFASLPAKIRARFDNDPAAFLAFFNDPANQDEAIKLGLALDTRPPPPPVEAAPTPENTPPAQSNGG
jgi:phage internal scaffolding protein